MQIKTTRSCVVRIAVTVGVLSTSLVCCAAGDRTTQPDILLIMPDQMRGDGLSILGHPAVSTPHMDQLAKQVALFRRVYATVASCIPARHALLKGEAHMDGVNLVPTLRGQTSVIREWLHFEHAPCYSKAQAYQALTDGHVKYLWRLADGREHLFNLDMDPHEERDLSMGNAHAAT
ncbi:MAG: sulfatase-like hydrolase/transferase [Planctomycetes bacterium]|nr:sulfatase-like hydrolase/transferase [Planctomycetota bacterium]